jgi:tRNA(adenine34) deaminase
MRLSGINLIVQIMPENISHPWDFLHSLTLKAIASNEVPVAAVLIKNNKIIAFAHNLVETHQTPTLHAEMSVLQEGFIQVGKYLTDCDLYVSLEPCPMCAHAIKLSQLKRLYFGAYDPKGGGVVHGPRILDNLPRLQVFGGFYESEFNILLKDFFQNRRQ